ncbi:hypothetical protein K2173_002824 [Erythroxylum novogranatense]|uniref:Uncharacterized protein n=1 Tax=Erythroxylum novogranatense TaxID=1862640 RepID=A0AAV8SQN3_9ROSI|nr:hypothetical protein K2173_002824 [Erythroxylum novogranatense]
MSRRGQQKAVQGAMSVMGTMGLCIVGYIVGPPLYWHISDLLTAALRSSSSSPSSSSSYCPPCFCDCSSDPLISMENELSNASFLDCMKHEPELSEEIEKSFTHLLSEEVKLKEAEALKSQRRADVALLEAKKMASQFQKEADKCNAGMETCEEARERAAGALEAQRKLSAMWESRARQRGWKEGITSVRAQQTLPS